MLLVLVAGAAQAGVLYDLNTGVYTELDVVDVTGAVVTAVRYNGFSCTELPAGPYTAVWVYTGGAPGVVEGDVVDLANATYKEYYELTELDLPTNSGTVTVTGTATVPSLPMTLAAVQADNEAWESHVITITDGFAVSELLSYGNWNAISQDSGLVLLHDDYFFDESILAVGDCYQGVTGMYTYAYDAYTMEPLVDGLTIVDCTVDGEDMSFGAVKALYR